MKKKPTAKPAPFDCKATRLIRACMKRKHENVTSLSRDLRCTPGLAQRIVEGRIEPRIGHVFQLRDIFGVPVEYWKREAS